jgi:hypothetical protein
VRDTEQILDCARRRAGAASGRIVARLVLGGLHHVSERAAYVGRTPWLLQDVAPRQRWPVGARFPRLTIEVHPEDERLVRRARSAAVLRGEPLREWLLEAIRQRLARDGEADAGR